MIRFQHIFLILCSAILFVRCTADELPGIDEKSAMTYLQVYIPRIDMQSRTTGPLTAPGTQGENAVSDVMLYFVNSQRIAKVVQVSMTGTQDNYVSELVPIGVDMLNQEFQLFVVANSQKADFVPRTTRDLKGIYSTQSATSRLLTPGQMLMSNQVEQSPVATITVTKENTVDNPAKAHVMLDRLAAKIEPQVAVDFQAEFTHRPSEAAFFADYTFEVEAAGLLNAATEFNLEQQWSTASGGQPIQLLSPTWYYKPEAAYFDKYYHTISAYTGTNAPPFVEFNTANNGEGFRVISSPFYCLENNSPFYDYTGSTITPENQVKTKYKGLTTGVIFKVRAMKGSNAATFYHYEGKYYLDTAADRLALTEAAGLSPTDFNSPSSLRAKEVKVYENGDIYYTYWIKDQNPAYAGDDYDLSYAVVRNSYYILRALGITHVGDDIPGGGYEPEEPIDKIVQLEIIAICQDWTLVDVTHEFN